MKNILLPIAIIALLCVSCHRGQPTQTDNPTKSLISKIDYTDEWNNQRSVTLKYDDQDRLTEMVSTEAEHPTTITYEGDNATVVMPCVTTHYVVDDPYITAQLRHGPGDFEDYDIHYTLQDGVIIKCGFFVQSMDFEINYTWTDGSITKMNEMDREFWDDIFFPFKYMDTDITLSEHENPWNIDVLGIIDVYDLSDPQVGSLFDGFHTKYLPAETYTEGTIDGFPSQHTTRYEYVLTDGRITEIHIDHINVIDYTDQDDGEVEREESHMTAKISYME